MSDKSYLDKQLRFSDFKRVPECPISVKRWYSCRYWCPIEEMECNAMVVPSWCPLREREAEGQGFMQERDRYRTALEELYEGDRHTHISMGGSDQCALCTQDIRHDVHLRSGEKDVTLLTEDRVRIATEALKGVEDADTD